MKHKKLPLNNETIADKPFPDPLPLHEAIDRLPPEHRTVIVLHYLEGYTVAEIAKILGIPSGTIKSRLRKSPCRSGQSRWTQTGHPALDGYHELYHAPMTGSIPDMSRAVRVK